MLWWLAGAGTVIYGLFVLWLVLRLRRQRREQMRLHWPLSTTQPQMELWGDRYLRQQGWEVSLMLSRMTVSMYQIFKQDDELFVVFLRDSAFFKRLLMTFGPMGHGVLHRLVIVVHAPPTEQMIRDAGEQHITLLHYRDLPELELRMMTRLPHITGAREAARAAREAAAPERVG